MVALKSIPERSVAGYASVPDAEDVSEVMAPQLHFAEKMIERNIEMLDFLKSRFERDRDMLGKLAEQRDPLKAMSLWGEFWQCTMTDYGTQMAKLATSASGLAEQAVRTATEEGEAIAKASSSSKGRAKTRGVSLTDVPV